MSILQTSQLSSSGEIIIPTNNSLYGVDLGSISAPGLNVQTVYARVDTKSTYSLPINTNTEITDLTLTITPKSATSVILLQYMVTFEVHYNTIFRLSRNGVVIGTNTTDANRWSGWANPGHDQDVSSTPNTNYYMYWDLPATTSPVTYRFLCSPTDGTAQTFYLNRAAGGAGSDAIEVGISYVILQEVAQ